MCCNNYWQQYCNPRCNRCACMPPLSCATGFSFLKRDAVTGAPIENAGFSLRCAGTVVSTAFSDVGGYVRFAYVVPGVYDMREDIAPAGYQRNSAIYTVVKDEYGFVTIDGQPSGGFAVENAPL
ncbi:prealbumin-like fold domain-containing protein [Christensenellaceae bacterium OttesenSCG-928-M15]|nr:prealbumin-like fold domain-containing protein [Christensenellaceae bacterium OttesenSCG-928-M15]